jgi:hypothetical protein
MPAVLILRPTGRDNPVDSHHYIIHRPERESRCKHCSTSDRYAFCETDHRQQSRVPGHIAAIQPSTASVQDVANSPPLIAAGESQRVAYSPQCHSYRSGHRISETTRRSTE